MSLQFNRFLLFGDSITEFCFDQRPYLRLRPNASENTEALHFSLGAALANDYSRKLDILRRGFAGYSTRQARLILPLIFQNDHDNLPETQKIKIMTIFFGTNDCVNGGPQRVPLDEFADNLKFMIEESLKRNIKLIIVGPSYHDPTKWEPDRMDQVAMGWIRTTENTVRYTKELKKLSAEYNLPFLDLHALFEDYSIKNKIDAESLLVDGVHYTGDGYKIFYDALIKAIDENYPELSSQNLERRLPYWRDIDDKVFAQKLQNELKK
ncbi:hypothetical protein PACTADRAFT_57624 [Pachysolen tannophilus NRRL Y-2460]|uniref:SGNH hydrolase-type esterase domain-containing protein n=1 Tax=Pachysolen tannophilus NRRL Y-2460 TaxID=669874 RepID=A0A1E4TTJ2_PACTA|nr:hypothetical protein PACTADRAFT_57624 [Pachysolen tannophilus NRRL Y-2460]